MIFNIKLVNQSTVILLLKIKNLISLPTVQFSMYHIIKWVTVATDVLDLNSMKNHYVQKIMNLRENRVKTFHPWFKQLEISENICKLHLCVIYYNNIQV